MKRLFDMTCALAGLVILAPLMALVALAVWIEDRHSPWFLGKRVAQGGGTFRMLKLRTMVPDAWKTGVNSTATGDSRITRVGRLLRAAKLDEIPQLWNVLTGDMSLVGPRPQVPADAALYTNEERRMLTVRPGITDLASIVFADEGRILAGAEDPDLRYNQIIRPWKSRLALIAIERSTPITDLFTILLTLMAAVSRHHALGGVVRILRTWKAEPELIQVACRSGPLVASHPPGATGIVMAYPNACNASEAGTVKAGGDPSRPGSTPAIQDVAAAEASPGMEEVRV